MSERELIEFRDDVLILVAEVCAIERDDLPELRRAELKLKLASIRAACDDLEACAEREADEQALKDEPPAGRCPDMSWVR